MVAASAPPGLRAPALAVALALTFATPRTAGAQQPDRQSIGTFSIDRTEVTIRAFAAFANATGLVTEAERAGGGFEWAGGWTRRPGWTFRTPYGTPPATDDEPAVGLPPWCGGVRSEYQAASRMVIASMLARASAGVR
jgi:Sulfatase-modifying factor enzyme 1